MDYSAQITLAERSGKYQCGAQIGVQVLLISGECRAFPIKSMLSRIGTAGR